MSFSTESVSVEGKGNVLLFARIGMALLLVIAVVAAIAAPLTLEVGNLSRPAPGFWVFWVAAATTVFVAGTFVRRSVLTDGVEPLRRSDAPVILALPVLALIVPMLTLLGVSITTVLVCLYWLRVISHASWKMTVLGSVLITAGIWIVFIYLLGVPFTPGTLIQI